MSQNINTYLAKESGRLTYDIYQRTLYSSPWLSLPKKVAWPQEMGETMSNVMFERPYVATENAWESVSFNDGTDNTCLPTNDSVQFHQTLREMQLYHKSVYSPKFCVNDLLFTGARQKQMESVVKALNEQVRYYWIKWNRDNWTQWSNKVIAEPGLDTVTTETTTTFGTTEATSQLTNGTLEYYYEQLILEQGTPHSLSVQNGRPIFGLITDQVTSRRLTRDDDAIREDYRNSSERDLLLQPLGVTHTYNGFIHMIDDMPPRYSFAGGVYTVIEPYILDTSGVNDKLVVNPLYRSADFQDSYIYVRDAMQFRVPGSVTGVSQAKFDPQNYMGDFKWLNVQNDDESSDAYNPDKTLGRFRGVLMSASEGINPHLMFTIRHKVCTSDFGLVGCV